MLLPVVAGAVALIAALAGFAMVKFFGVVFLGQPREEKLAQAHDASRLERYGLLWLAAGCVLLGLLPNVMIALLDPVTRQLVGGGLRYAATSHGWWLLAPISEDRASYSPAAFFASIALFMAFVYWAVRRYYHGRAQRVAAWDCGFPLQTSRMQEHRRRLRPTRSAASSRRFSNARANTRRRSTPSRATSASSKTPLWYWLYLPLARLVEHGTRLIAFLQHGSHRDLTCSTALSRCSPCWC